MKRKNATRNALVTSVISMLLCVSMLVGTTFAWFTDEVVTGMNTIAAGNLDVELLANGAQVDTTTKLFSAVEKWEPGVVVYENLQVVNVGTLALKYQMTLNFGDENAMTDGGYKLSEVLEVAVIDKVADNATRAQVLEAAKASSNIGTLSNFLLRGELLPAGQTDAATGKSDKSAEQTIVIFWAPNDNEIDNRYNANNGKTTTDGEPLHISFGVNLQATQLMHEEDSFGNDYDEFAGFVPVANTNDNGALTISTTMNDMGSSAAAQELTLDASYQFKPTETYEQAQQSPYRYYHADFVITADKAVPANSVALAGYYQAYCEGFNNDNWVAFTSTEEIAANTPIRLVYDAMGVYVNYEELCLYADIEDPDNVGFLCGLKDMTGANAGTTVTVELRMYETTKAPDAAGGTANDETGEYITVGKYEYTFGANTAAGLQAALAAGNSEIKLNADIELAADETLNVSGNTVIDLDGHTISGKATTSTTSYMIEVASGAELTLTGNGKVSFYATTPDTEWGGEGQPPFPGYANNTIRCKGKLIIDGVTVENLTAPGGASYAIDCYQGSDLIINSGVIDGKGKCAIRMFCNSNTLPTNVTVNGGTITGKRAIWVQLPGSNIANVRPVNLTINGGKLICTNTDADVCVYSYSYGDSFANTNITITGGEFTGDVAFGGGNAKTTQENVTITGGIFNGEVGRWVTADTWEAITVPTV